LRRRDVFFAAPPAGGAAKICRIGREIQAAQIKSASVLL
jgi:hypothetical protein